MAFLSDLEIARGATLTPLAEVAAAMGPAATRIDIDSRGEIVGLS